MAADGGRIGFSSGEMAIDENTMAMIIDMNNKGMDISTISSITETPVETITEKDKQDLVVQRAARWLKPPEEYEEKPKRKRRKKKKEDKEPERTTEDINKLADIIKKKTSA